MKILLCLLLLISVVVAQKKRRTFRGRLNFINKRILDGLFLNKKELFAIAERNIQQTPIYRLKDFKVIFEHAASCSPSLAHFKPCQPNSGGFTPKEISAGENQNGQRRQNGARGNPCCDTTMVLVQPNTVSCVDSSNYDVVQEPDSVQVVHIGMCNSAGAVCSNNGFCTQEYRMQWILVHTSPGEKKFVPVEMHNHCVCNYV